MHLQPVVVLIADALGYAFREDGCLNESHAHIIRYLRTVRQGGGKKFISGKSFPRFGSHPIQNPRFKT